jgi:hypothetical protein
LHVSEVDGNEIFSSQLFFERSRSINGSREWLYELQLADRSLPFNRTLLYEIESIDAMGTRDIVSSGNYKTISREMFRLKQAEVLTHGTIITAFGGLFVVMMLYSI